MHVLCVEFEGELSFLFMGILLKSYMIQTDFYLIKIVG